MGLAVIIGIDDYRAWPLSSAVNDALAFRDKLVAQGLVEASAVRLLTSPAQPGGTPATSRHIARTMYEVYRDGDAIDRLFFFFAGHGVMAFVDAAMSQAHTALVPADVEDLASDGKYLIDFDELRDKLALTGPREQFYFIDACRNLDHDRHPDVGRLGWEGRPPGAARIQRTLYAVSPLGKALAMRAQHGVMTRHLLDALDGDGAALEYSEALDAYVVTFESLASRVTAGVLDAVRGQPLYLRTYMLPQVQASGAASPLRRLTDVAPTPFTVHIEPEEAAPHTSVRVRLRRMALPHLSYPPRQNHEAIALEPQRYALDVASTWGTVEPARRIVHAGTEREATIVVHRPPAAPSAPAIGEAVLAVQPEDGVPGAVVKGVDEPVLEAVASDPQTTIEVRGLDHPHRVYTGRGRLEQPLAPGPYAVWFRLGAETFSRKEIYLHRGDRVTIAPSVTASPLLAEALRLPDGPAQVVVSEASGAIQSAVLPTLLAMLGVKAIDPRNTVLRSLDGVLAARSPDELGLRPLVLIVATDGDGWQIAPAELRAQVAAALVHDAARQPLALRPLDGAPLPDHPVFGPRRADTGLDRIAIGVTAAPAGSFWLELSSTATGTLRVAAVARRARVTVVCVTLRPDGSFDLTQNLLRLPGHPYVDEPVPDISYDRMLREIVLGQRLYADRALVATWLGPDTSREEAHVIARHLLRTKWTCPVLGCMAYFACHEAAVAPELMAQTARSLAAWFGDDLPDARIALALDRQATSDAAERDAIFAQLLATRAAPVLAYATRQLAMAAVRLGDAQHPIVDLARRIPIEQSWTVLQA